MAVQADIITVTTTATLLCAGGSITDPKTVVVDNASANMFLGGADVDTTEGFPFTAASTPLTLVLSSQDALYARVASGTATVNVLRTRS